MTLAIQSKTETITAWDIIPRLARYQMLPQLIRESIIDEAIESIECTPEEIATACQIFERQNQLQTEAQKQAWADSHGMTPEDIEEIATRKLKIEKFKQQQWGGLIKSYFLQRKAQLDKVAFSIIRVANRDLAQELYFRIQDKEQSFAELAQQYSQGAEASLGGMVAPIELGSLPTEVARLLQNRQAGELLAPFPMADFVVIIQVEQKISATLDPLAYQRLLNEKFQTWLQKQIGERGVEIKNLQFDF